MPLTATILSVLPPHAVLTPRGDATVPVFVFSSKRGVRDVDQAGSPHAVAHQTNPLRSTAQAHTLGVGQTLLVPATAPAAVAGTGRDEAEGTFSLFFIC